MAFPRLCQPEVPEAVKIAQFLEALSLTDTESALRRQLQLQGVKSISLGHASESYAGVATGSTFSGAHNMSSQDAKVLLRPYLAGTGAMV